MPCRSCAPRRRRQEICNRRRSRWSRRSRLRPALLRPAGQQPIVIEPVNPDVYYVPVYNPAVVYGAWGYPDYPPFYWSPPGFVASNIVSFAAGVAVGAAIWGGCDWWHNNVIINVNRYNVFNRTDINITNNIWVHNPGASRQRALPQRCRRGAFRPRQRGCRARCIEGSRRCAA